MVDNIARDFTSIRATKQRRDNKSIASIAFSSEIYNALFIYDILLYSTFFYNLFVHILIIYIKYKNTCRIYPSKHSL